MRRLEVLDTMLGVQRLCVHLINQRQCQHDCRSKTAINLYPDSDGKPMADNTLQYRWIVRLVTNLKPLFRGQTVFVAGDLFWYPQVARTRDQSVRSLATNSLRF